MAADLGTKPLSAVRMDNLKVICGMSTEVENETSSGKAMVPDEEKMLIVASLVQAVKSQGDEEGQERQHARREDDAIMWMMVALYTFLVIIAVTVFQRAFGAWKQYTDDLAEGQREDTTITREQRRRIRQAHILLDEAERQRNYAEHQLFQAVADVYRPRPISELGSSRRTSLVSGRSSGRRSREEFEDQESERRGGGSSSAARRDFSEEYQRTEEGSQVTREYVSPGSGEEEGRRFNAFEPARREDERLDESQGDGRSGLTRGDEEHGEARGSGELGEAREGEGHEEHDEVEGGENPEAEEGQEMDAENRRRVELPEYRGPGRYVEDATRGLRRRVDGPGEEDEEEEEQEDPMDDVGSDFEEMSVRSERGVEVGQHVGPPQPRGPEPPRDLRPEDGEPDGEPEEGADGDQRPGVRGGDDPGPQELPGDMPNYQAWITPAGTRYHTTRDCVTLAQTRRTYRSQWCELCGRRLPGQRYGEIYVARPGEGAHHNLNCPNIGLRLATTYPCCQPNRSG